MSPYSSKKRFSHGLFLVVSGLLFSVVAAGCSLGDADTDGNVFYQIDQNFREVYRFLGGEKYMGPAITEPFTQNDVAYQYFKSGLLYWDWKREDSRYWHLAPLGLKLGVEQPPVEPPAGPDTLYIGGHIVHPTFVPRYQQLGGEAVVGRPVTEARYEDNGNLRQYFSNLGFEVGPGQGPDDVRYLPYGEWSCDANCRSQPQLAAPNLNFTDEGIAAPPQRVELPGRLSMEPWHKFDQLGPQETQEIGVTVFAESKPLELSLIHI